MASIAALPVKQLVRVLAHLRGGEIGFDPYRDPRTSKKDALLSFILANHTNDAIIAAVGAVEAQIAAIPAVSDARPVAPPNHVMAQAMPAIPVHTAATDDAAQIAALLSRMAGKASVDAESVKRIVADSFIEEKGLIAADRNRLVGDIERRIAALSMPVTVHVTHTATGVTRDMGHQHKNFASLLKMAQAVTHDGHRLNIWLKGPAGSGKTTAAKKVATALDMPFHFNGAISTEYELMGFKDAAGAYHRTAFRDAFENGGVYLFDEIDSSLPKAVLAFNAALANGACRFPDAMVARHKDCVILAGANTAGNGATADYVGRMKQDLAFLNRFVLLDWPLDETLETALAHNKKWVARVQKLRANAESRGIKGHIISPRATFYGQALLAAGLDAGLVEHATLRGALSNDQWKQLCR